MRVIGKVKSFDRTAGVGYAVTDGGAQAVFTAAALEPFGLTQIEEGAALTFEMTLDGGRLRVAKIYDIAGRAPDDSGPDAAKGFGFKVSKDLAGDVLLHKSVVDAFGAGPVLEGAAVDRDVVQIVKRLQAAPPPGTRWRGRGRVVSYDGAKGFGMVEVEGHDYDALLHHRVLQERFGFAAVGARTVLDCAFERGLKGTKVTKVYGVLEVGDAPPRERVLGTVDWFDPVKVFGFVRTTAGDAMLHMREVNELGRVTIGAGAKIDCDIIREVRGLRICRVNCVLSEGELPPSATMDATCKWFSRPKGFGLLKADTDADIFIHMDTLRRAGLRELRQGQRLRVLALRREKGLFAISVEALLG